MPPRAKKANSTDAASGPANDGVEAVIDEGKKKRNYMFTLNNYTPQDIIDVLAWKGAKYIVFGEEQGDVKQTPHLQGYVEWAEGKAIVPTLQKLTKTPEHPNGRAHWEARKAPTGQQAAEYCKKGDQTKAEWNDLGTAGPSYGLRAKVHERGTISAQGTRTDLNTCAEMIRDGASLRDVAEAAPSTFVKFHKGFTALKSALMEHRTEKPSIEWRWGLAGVGKTRGAVEKHPDHYIKDGTQWWDGYEQQEAIIIDDFDGKWPFRDLLRLLDRNRYQGQYKGGYWPINSPYIYITAEHPPATFWSGNELAQVTRRLDSVVQVGAVSASNIVCTDM